MYKNPWKTLQTKKIYENPWISVTESKIINPAGKPGIYGNVHFKNWAIGIIPLDESYNTWLVGQYRYALDAYSWEIPEGGCPLHTEPLETAKRELKEETGIEANKWTTLLDIHTSNSVTDEFGIVYVAQDLRFGESEPEETEQLSVWKLPFDEAFAMVMKGQITDSLSVAGILKAQFLIINNAL
ncbi:MAG: NUDIX hydrolase [Chitinophagales bacterium]|nr:NUDIX hydrolase [Bacteroidota bacterium]MCB9044400.1 NUDIX hydrolase [Chitinophagales bacterium]